MTKTAFEQKQLITLTNEFNAAFESHRRFPLDATERFARGERISLYSGTPEEWTAALYVEQDLTTGTITHTLALTQKPLSPRMREHLSAAAARFEEAVQLLKQT